jgi:hypothetical protein
MLIEDDSCDTVCFGQRVPADEVAYVGGKLLGRGRS